MNGGKLRTEQQEIELREAFENFLATRAKRGGEIRAK